MALKLKLDHDMIWAHGGLYPILRSDINAWCEENLQEGTLVQIDPDPLDFRYFVVFMNEADMVFFKLAWF